MAKKTIDQDEDFKENPINPKDIQKYRQAVAEIKPEKRNGIIQTKFDLLMEKWGFAKIVDGYITVTNVSEFSYWIKYRDSVESTDAWRAEEVRNLFPKEKEAHQNKVRSFVESIKNLAFMKKL